MLIWKVKLTKFQFNVPSVTNSKYQIYIFFDTNTLRQVRNIYLFFYFNGYRYVT